MGRIRRTIEQDRDGGGPAPGGKSKCAWGPSPALRGGSGKDLEEFWRHVQDASPGVSAPLGTGFWVGQKWRGFICCLLVNGRCIRSKDLHTTGMARMPTPGNFCEHLFVVMFRFEL